MPIYPNSSTYHSSINSIGSPLNHEDSNNTVRLAQNISKVETVSIQIDSKPRISCRPLEQLKKTQFMPKYHDTWLKWQNEALITCPDEFEDRKIALKKLCACLYDKTLHLNFYGLEITSLPLLPPYITKLDISYTHLKKLPELPSTLKVLYCNYAKLESLPELSEKLEELYCDDNKLVNLPKLPPKLKALSCDNNRLVRLPELPSTLNGLSCENTCLESLPNLPIGLISLYCDLNYLKDLPALPAGMKAISCADNELDFLPALPLSLEELTCNNNNLTRLPPLPLSLNHLIASNNSLTELPEIPASVTHIDCQDNELTHLPESVYRLTRGLINVAYNPLSEQTCENLQAMTFLPEYRGLQIYFSMASQYNFEPTIRALTDSVIDWFPVERKLEIKSKYSAIANERNAEPFSAFIDRLQDTSSAKKDPMFKQQVAQWLNRLADSPKLRESSFIIADGATESCEDRVALMWNDLQKVEFIHNIEDGQYDDKLPQFVANAREMFRLDQLEQISRENVNTLHDVDDIEVYLGYQTQLCIPLELASTGKEMYFFDVSGITSSDLNVAELRVKTAENHQFPEWFAQWSPWQKLIERTEPALWEKAYDKKIDIYENEYQNRINAELNDCELMGDVDAERALGIKVMHDIDKTIFIPLTWEALANKKQESLLNKKWNI